MAIWRYGGMALGMAQPGTILDFPNLDKANLDFPNKAASTASA